MEGKKRSAVKWLCISLALMVIGLAGAALVQTSGGWINVKSVEFAEETGLILKGTLYIPQNVTTENKAPAVVICHGMYADSGILDTNFVELSRRGYIVLSFDEPSHGESDNSPSISNIVTAGYDAVKFVSQLPFVDPTRIGITGHSLGGAAASTAVQKDVGYQTNMIKSALINSTAPQVRMLDPNTFASTGDYYNAYGSTDIAVIAGKIDEFGFVTTDEEGRQHLPKEYIDSYDAQFFLHSSSEFDASDIRDANSIYSDTVNNTETKRAIYTTYSWHTLTSFNPNAIAYLLDWFDDTLNTPNPIPSSNQIWPLKMIFNLIGLIGFGIFIYSFALSMLFVPAFASLRVPEIIKPRKNQPGDKKWFWLLLVICPVFGSGIYIPLMNNIKAHTWFRDPWRQPDSWGIAMWTMLVAVFSLGIMLLIYYAQWRKQGISLKERGIAISLPKLGKTILLAVLTVIAAYTCVFAGKFFFQTDFRFYEMIRVVPFKASKLSVIFWPYLPLFAAGYIASSIANNSFNYKVAGKSGKGQWRNTALCAVMSALPGLVLYVPAYIFLTTTGANLFPSGFNMQFVSWLISTLVVMPASTVIGRKLYIATNNPYIGGIICGMMMTMIKCMSTLTWA